MSELIANHLEKARDRLRQQYKGKPKLDAVLSAVMAEVQELEQMFFDMGPTRSLYGAVGMQLDTYGLILDLPRNGLEDETYRIRLLARIAQNVSSGTGDDISNIYKLLMRARYVQLTPSFPAGVNLTAVGANQIGDINDIKEAVEDSLTGGVSVNLFQVVDNIPLVFLEDPDPLGQGLSDLNDPSVGGYLSSII